MDRVYTLRGRKNTVNPVFFNKYCNCYLCKNMSNIDKINSPIKKIQAYEEYFNFINKMDVNTFLFMSANHEFKKEV